MIDGLYIRNEIQMETLPAQLGMQVVVFTAAQGLVEEPYLKQYATIIERNSQGFFEARFRIQTIAGAAHTEATGLRGSNRFRPAVPGSSHRQPPPPGRRHAGIGLLQFQKLLQATTRVIGLQATVHGVDPKDILTASGPNADIPAAGLN